MKLVIIIISGLILISCTTEEQGNQHAGVKPKTEKLERAQYGIWQLVEEFGVVSDNSVFYPFHTAFVYDHKTVTVELVTLSNTTPHPTDNKYRLIAQYQNDTLYYFIPARTKKVALAYYRDGAFYTTEKGIEWKYEKISKDELREYNMALVKQGREIARKVLPE